MGVINNVLGEPALLLGEIDQILQSIIWPWTVVMLTERHVIEDTFEQAAEHDDGGRARARLPADVGFVESCLQLLTELRVADDFSETRGQLDRRLHRGTLQRRCLCD